MAVSWTTVLFEYIFPVIGILIGTSMFAAPLRDVIDAGTNHGSLRTLNPLPWIFMSGNCFGWVTYSILVQNVFIFIGNAPGFLISLYLNFQAMKLIYCDQYYSYQLKQAIVRRIIDDNNNNNNNNTNQKQQQQQRDHHPAAAETSVTTYYEQQSTMNEVGYSNTILHDDLEKRQSPSTTTSELFMQLIWNTNIGNTDHNNNNNSHSTNNGDDKKLDKWTTTPVTTASKNLPVPTQYETYFLLLSIAWISLVGIISFANRLDDTTRERIIGIAVNLNLVFFYGAPLSTIYAVWKDRNSSSIHFPTMLLNTINSTFWGVYGLAILDFFVAVPNCLGIALGIVQILLCVLFPRRPKQKAADISCRSTIATAPVIAPSSSFSKQPPEDHNGQVEEQNV